jgi:hypothetical protein
LEIEIDFVQDSGCTEHIVQNSQNIYDLVKCSHAITTANGQKAYSSGYGKIDCMVKNGQTRIHFERVNVFPDIATPLLLILALADSNISVKFGKSAATICLPNGGELPATRKSNLFLLTTLQRDTQCLSSEGADKNEKWQRRLGHIGVFKMGQVVKSYQLSNIKIPDLRLCSSLTWEKCSANPSH